jgi:hypothetical protein
MRPRAWPNLARIALGVRESSMFDLPRIMRGFRFSLEAMWAEASRLNLLELAPTLEMPVFFFLGRKDHWVPPEVSMAYFEALTAPSKKLVWFDQSGHEPFVDEPAKFNALMAELVRPALPSEASARAPSTASRSLYGARQSPGRHGEYSPDESAGSVCSSRSRGDSRARFSEGAISAEAGPGIRWAALSASRRGARTWLN